MSKLSPHWPKYLLVAIVASSAFWPLGTSVLNRLAMGWDLGVAVFLVIIFARLVRDSSPEAIRVRAQEMDQAGSALLPLAILAALASIVVVISEAAASHGSGQSLAGANLALITVVLSWVFVHTLFALRYAHTYYRDPEGGLIFPGTPSPDDWDFIHFAFVIGVASQTADIAISDQRLRRLVTCHCLLAFVFNTVVLALAVNFAVTLLGS